MRILIPIMKFGKEGGFRVLSNLATEFVKKGHEVDIVVSAYSMSPYFPTFGNIIYADEKGVLYQKPKDIKRGWKPYLSLYKGIRSVCTQRDYDIILANHCFTVYPIYFARTKSTICHYIQAYEPDFYAEVSGVKNLLLTYLAKGAYHFNTKKIVNSSLYLNYKEIKTNMMVLPGLDLTNYFPKENVTIPKAGHNLIIGTIGRREPMKGTKYIIEAFNKLRSEHKNIELHIAFGEESQADEKNNIIVVQPHGDVQLANFYRSLDIYVGALTAQFGAVHYPLIESMATGTAVVATSYYPLSEANGWVVLPKCSDCIAKRIEDILNGDREYSNKKQQALIDVKQFEWSVVSDKMLKYFEEVKK